MRPTRLAATLLLLALVACSTAERPAAVEGTATHRPETPVAIPLDDYSAGLKTARIEVGGVAGDFLFDTGGGVEIVTPRVSERLGCTPYGRGVGFRHDGTRIEAPLCASPPWTAGGWTLGTEEPAVYDLMALLQGAPEIDGLLSLAAFEGQAVTLDYPSGRLIVESSESLAERTATMERLRVRPSRQMGGHALDLFVAVDAGRGRTLWLELDSGNAGPVILSPHAAELLGVDLSAGPADVTLDVAGLGPVTVTALEKETIYDGLLNLELHQRYLMTLDLATMDAWAVAIDR